MKRSTQLILISAAGAAAFLAYNSYSSETDIDASVFSSLDECIEAGIEQDICATQLSDATDAHVKSAPRYENIRDCENDFGSGKCTEQTNNSRSGSVFLPAMAGFMMARALQSGHTTQHAPQPVYGCGARASSGPASASGQNCYSNRNGRSFYVGRGAASVVKASSSIFQNNQRYSFVRSGSSVQSRGGLGSSGRGYSGFGS